MSPRSENLRTVAAGEQIRKGRLSKARQFLQVADDARELAADEDVADAAATLYVHAGVAAADAICAGALGAHSKGEDHQQAIELLATVDRASAKHLRTLLSMKTRAGYGHDPLSLQNLTKAERTAHALVERASR